MTFPILGGNSAVTGAYSIDNSLRFNDNDSAYLTRTNSSGGDRQKFTTSFWIKRGNLTGSGIKLFDAGTSTSTDTGRFFIGTFGTEKLVVVGGATTYKVTSQVFRDVSAWYHIIVAVDSTQGTADNRIKIYVNGNQITSFDTNNTMTLNLNTPVNENTKAHQIGRNQQNGTEHYDGYIAETYLIDGTAKAPTDFGEFDSTSGIWKPKEYSGSYGTNGFHLDFEDSSSLGNDVSGNNNDFTATNLASTDQTTDTPTNNFCTLNSVRGAVGSNSSNTPLSEGNLKAIHTDNAYKQSEGTIFPTSGKWYWETLITNSGNDAGALGIVTSGKATGAYPGTTINGYGYDSYGSGSKIHNGSRDNSYGSSYSANDIMGTALDLDNGTLTFYKNNSSQGQAYSGIDASLGWGFGQGSYYATNGIVVNFGQEGSFAGNKTAQGNSDENGFGDFYYAPPSGYLALCTQNLATELSPTIDDGSEYFHTQLYTGNRSSTQTITNDANAGDFQPDWVWIKQRNDTVAHSHNLIDSSRGATKHLYSNTTDSEGTISGGLTSFNTDGFSIGNNPAVNQPDRDVNYVAWQWKANGGTTSNTNGSITSTVSANTTAGFSIVTYTGTGSVATIGHGLGKVPAMMIVKKRSGTDDWAVYHDGVLTPSNARYHYMQLNTTNAYAGDGTYWNDTAPTTSVFTVGTNSDVNSSSATYVAYCFAGIEGYSKFGSYAGNGNANGTFVYTGFKPAFVMMKSLSALNGWNIFDSTRGQFNPTNEQLQANSSGAGSSVSFDILSNGFKPRTTSTNWNGGSDTYMYWSFASNPFVTSSGVPIVAR